MECVYSREYNPHVVLCGTTKVGFSPCVDSGPVRNFSDEIRHTRELLKETSVSTKEKETTAKEVSRCKPNVRDEESQGSRSAQEASWLSTQTSILHPDQQRTNPESRHDWKNPVLYRNGLNWSSQYPASPC